MVCSKAVLFPAQVNTLLESRDSEEVEGECGEGSEEAAVLPGDDPTCDLAAPPELRASTEFQPPLLILQFLPLVEAASSCS